MPTYVDRHVLADVPRATQQQMHREAAYRAVDRYGAQPMAHWVTDGVIYCIIRAPDEQALRKHHADHGLACNDVHRIASLRGDQPLGQEEMDAIRGTLGTLWPAGLAA
jgi:hypothetical protein